MKNVFVLLFVFVGVIYFSCKKRAPLCTGNCVTLQVTGRVIDKLANTGAPDIAVSLNWSNSVWRLDDLVIGKVHSQNDGKFDFTVSIDTSYFSNHYYLSLYIDGNKQYLILGYSGLTSLRSYSSNPGVFQGVQFEVYKKAGLKIRLHRNQSDFTNFSIAHSNVVDNFFLYDYNVGSPKEVTDINKTELNVSTVADVFTKIRTVKTLSGGTTVTTLDSVKCTAGSIVVYDVYF